MDCQATVGWEGRQRVPLTPPHRGGLSSRLRHHQEDEDDEDLDRHEHPERSVAQTLRFVIGLLLADPYPSLGIECMALVTGIGYDGCSMAAIAERHKVTRQAVSKRCIELCETLGLPPTRAMRSVQNRARCRRARLREIAGLHHPSPDQ